MVRVSHKNKANKQGVVLITVLFILAMAMIFITSAIMMTNGTRKRVNVRAEASQARLTVTSVADSFYASLFCQEITDDQVKALAQNNSYIGTTLYITAPNFPGMSQSNSALDGTEAADFTTISISGKVPGYPDGKRVMVTVETHIGLQVDKVRYIFEYNTPAPTPNNFEYPVEVQGGGALDRMSIGYNFSLAARDPSADNIVLTRGNGYAPNDSTYYYSTFVTTAALATKSGTRFYGDVVFSGPDAYLDIENCNSQAIDMWGTNTAVYFLDLGDTAAINNTGTQQTAINASNGNTSATVVSYNSNVNGSSRQFNSTYTLYGSASGFSYAGLDTSVIQAFSANTTINNNITGNTGYLASKFYDTSAAGRITSFTQLGGYGITSQTAPAGAVTMALTNGSTYVGGKTYVVNQATMGAANDRQADNGLPVVTIDLTAGDCYVYLPNGLQIISGYFKIIGGDQGYHCYFIVPEGKRITIGVGYERSKVVGIIDTNCYGDPTGEHPENYGVDSNLDQAVKPAVYVFMAGVGSNSTYRNFPSTGGSLDNQNYGQLTFGKQGTLVLTAYCGLYNSSATSDDAGSVYFMQGDKVHFYGRINSYSLKNGQGSAANCHIPYCPGPVNALVLTAPRTVASNYTFIEAQYYTIDVPAAEDEA